jgi:hypothetical protein
MENIKQYLGIPAELIPQVFWVGREYRKNELSFKNGGVEIIIEYTDGQVFGYDWVKYPGRYIKKVFDNTFLVNAHLNEFETIKKNVSRVFARRCDSEDYNAESFTEVWNNSTSENLPYTLLDNYILKVYKYYLNFFLNNIEFAKQYISMHYPFDYSFLIENWSFLEQGTAHYCVYLIDTETIYPSIFGLAFNKNIRWNSKLRARFEYGFDNHFIGYVEGTGIGPVEFEERDYLDNMIPLDKQK